ncbi:MAG: phosphate acyltransferase PlsX [Ignavibacteriae bacterium]|nr:MAG: phosphate acyltransferase PlsX [Ignavibacteriota bacterium]
MSKCKIAVDAMGGDFAPRNAVVGAINAYDENKKFDLLLVGREKEIQDVILSENLKFNKQNIIHADEVIEMGDSPSTSLRAKQNSSIVVGAKLVNEKKAHAFLSAGNTGAMVMSSVLNTGRIKGVSRPTLTAPFPNEKNGYTFISDVGAFVDSKPQHLLEFAILSSIFIEEIYGIENPKIGLLNVGEEAGKGYKLTSEATKLLSGSHLNFVGNIEGKDIFRGTADLVICDGFIGNILLKFAESIIPFLKSKFKDYADRGFFNKLRIGIARTPLRESLSGANYELQGGLPLLGINGISIVGHGSSTALAIKNMVLRAYEMHEKNLIQKIEHSINQYSNNN